MAALVVVAVAVVTMTAIGLRYSRGEVSSVEEFITARDSIGTPTLVATLLASNMGAWILFSPAEAGAVFGGITAVAGYALGSAVASLVYVFVDPRIRQLIPRGVTPSPSTPTFDTVPRCMLTSSSSASVSCSSPSPRT